MNHANFTKEQLISKIDILEKELSDVKESIKTTFNRTAVGLAHVSRTGAFIQVNKMFAQMFGYDDDAMLEMNVNDITYPGEPSLKSPDIQKVWRGEIDHYSVEKRYVRKDKSIFWGSLSISLQKTSPGEQDYAIAVLQDITDKKEAVDRFLKEKEFSENLIKNLPGHFFICSIKGKELRLKQWNNNLETVTGYSAEELVNKNILDFYSDQYHPVIYEALDDLIKTGSFSTELVATMKNGDKIPIHYEGFLFSEEGENSYIGIGFDISEQVRAKEILQKNEEKYAAVVENSNDGIAIYQDGKIVYANKATERELGFLKDELIGKDIFELVAPEYRESIVQRTQARLAGDIVTEITEIELLTKDTTRIPVEANTSVIEYEGKPGLLVFIRNISARKIAEKNLKESEERFRMLSGITKEGVVIHRSGFALEVNKAFCDIFGYSVDEILGTNPMHKLFSPDTVQKLLESFKFDVSPQMEIEGIKKDGSIITLSVEGRAGIYKDERVRFGTIRDITDQKRAEEELIIKDRAIDSSINAIGIADLEGIMLYINQAGVEFWGYSSKEEILGRSIIEFWQKDHINKQFRDLQEKGFSNNEGIGIKKDGSLFNVQYSVHQVKDKNNEPQYIFGSFIDITEKRKAERALKEADERFSKAFFNLPDPVALTTLPDGMFIDVNPKFEKLSGYSAKELEGRSVTDSGFYVNHEAREKLLSELNDKGNLDGIELLVKNKEGQIRDCKIYSEQVDLQGKPCLLSIFREITEQKKAEEKIRFEQYLLHSLMNNSPDTIYFKDINSRFIRINKAHADKFGLNDPKDAIGKTDKDFFTGDHGKNTYIEEQNIIKTGKPIINKEEKQTWRDGKISWYSSSKLPFYNQEGKITGTFGITREITELKLSEQALKSSEERLKIIFEAAPDSIILINLEVKFLEGNKAAENLLGITAKEVVGKNLLELNILSDEDLPRARQQMGKSAMGMPTDPEEYIWSRKDGTRTQVEVSTFPVVIRGETLILAISRDITEKKKAEKELQKYREHLEELVKSRTFELENSLKENIKLSKAVEQSYATVVITDQEGNIEYVNESFTRNTGYPFEEIKNQNPRFLKSGELPDSHYKEMWETIITGQIWKGEFSNKKKNGEIYWESCIISPIVNEKEEITHYVAVKEDITERKKTDEELRQFKLFADTSIEGFGMAELDSRILYQNKRLCDLCGIEEAKVNESFLQFYPKEVQMALQKEIIPEMIKNGHWRGELDHLKAEGGTFPTIHNFFVIKDENGQPKRLAATITDITESKKIEAELKKSKEQAEEANRTKSTFLANMSHEIRTPMNSILGFSEMLSSKIEDPRHISYLKSIRSSGRSLLTLINDILDLSKVEAGGIKIDKQSIRSGEFFDDIKSIYQALSKEKNLAFTSSIKENLPPGLYLDELRLRQILTNLLGNAIKFTDQGSVRFSVHYKAAQKRPSTKGKDQFIDLIIKVEDSGIGISKEFLPKLFNSFQQEDGKITRQYGGTGLGLAISKKLAGLMNGDILVESTPNKGSVFTLILKKVKVVHEIEQPIPEYIFRADQVIFPKRTILIADDNAEIRKYFAEAFLDTNLVVKIVTNGKEALDEAQKTKPDLIITDITMPVMDGNELNKKLKKNPMLKGVPVIAITASAMKEQLDKLGSGIFDGVLLKPISYNDLMLEVQKFIKPKKLSAQYIEGQQNSELQLTDDLRNSLPEIIKIMESDWMDDWERLRKKQPMDEVEAFGIKIRTAGEKYQFDFLSNVGLQMIQSVQAFDIETIRRQMNEFPEILDKLRKMVEE